MTDRQQPQTRAVRAGLETDAAYGAVVPPIYLSSTFTFNGLNQRRKYDYSRSGNPTRDALAEALAGLESGAGAVVTATGMAAVGMGGDLVHVVTRTAEQPLQRQLQGVGPRSAQPRADHANRHRRAPPTPASPNGSSPTLRPFRAPRRDDHPPTRLRSETGTWR